MSQRKLPSEWCNAKLGDIVHYGKTQKCVLSDVSDSTWVLELEDVEKESSRVLARKTVSERPFKSTKNIFKKGNVLYGKLRPYLNKVVLADEQGVCTTEIIPLDAEPFVLNRYLFYWLKSHDFLSYVNEVSYGVNMPRLGTKDGVAAPIVLAPLAEQKVIADKLDTLLAQVDNTKARLERIPEILKRFRQSVLAAAVSGWLTEEWRVSNRAAEPWKKVVFSELLYQLRSGAGEKPSNDSRGVPILRSSAVRPMEIDFHDVKYLAESSTLKDSNYLKENDLLFTRLSGSAEYVGNCAMVKNIECDYQYPDRLFCARLINPEQGHFLEYFFAAQDFREHISRSLKSSAGHQRITLDVIKKATITLPTLDEQTEIVRRVDQLFAHADRIEQQVNQALARVNNLTQSILAKAFRGELTEQWRKDNPELITGDNSAEALLERIKVERAAKTPAKRTRKKATA